MARGTPWHGEVVSIHLAPKAEDPMKSVKAIRAIQGKGLEGDRYFHLEGLTRGGGLAGLIQRGGLRAQLLVGGEIRGGDPIAPADASEARTAAPIVGADEH